MGGTYDCIKKHWQFDTVTIIQQIHSQSIDDGIHIYLRVPDDVIGIINGTSDKSDVVQGMEDVNNDDEDSTQVTYEIIIDPSNTLGFDVDITTKKVTYVEDWSPYKNKVMVGNILVSINDEEVGDNCRDEIMKIRNPYRLLFIDSPGDIEMNENNSDDDMGNLCGSCTSSTSNSNSNSSNSSCRYL